MEISESPKGARRKKLDLHDNHDSHSSRRRRKKQEELDRQRNKKKKKVQDGPVSTGTILIRVLWALLSGLASALVCYGFYMPYWIQGKLLGHDAYFGSFRRCNYPRAMGRLIRPQIVLDCARYSSFNDIPSPWWQASTVSVGLGLAVSLIAALTVLAAVTAFLPHVLKSPKHTRVLGSFQLLAATMICGGLVMYPVGWDNQEVRDSCGKQANVYQLGKCSLSWSSYILVGAVALLMLCFGLSFCAARHKSSQEEGLRI